MKSLLLFFALMAGTSCFSQITTSTKSKESKVINLYEAIILQQEMEIIRLKYQLAAEKEINQKLLKAQVVGNSNSFYGVRVSKRPCYGWDRRSTYRRKNK